jgi:hypothetical protein
MSEQEVVNVAVGTYQGALAGWQLSASPPAVRVSYAFVAHQGPVRSIITGRTKAAKTTMVSTSSDESARVFDIGHQRGIGQLVKHSGEIQPQSRLEICCDSSTSWHASSVLLATATISVLS